LITDKLKEETVRAMKSGDQTRVSTLRMLSSSLHNAKIEKRGELSKDDEISVVQREAKRRKEAIDAYEKASESERADKERKELAILEEFLPEQLSDAELEKLVVDSINETAAKTVSDMGRVIGMVIGKAKGKVDGKRVSEAVKRNLGL
jgi:uncharacterized protein